MIKSVLIESVRKAILKQSSNNQDATRFNHPQVVADEIGKAYNQIMKTYYSSDNTLMNAELDFYAKTFTAKINKLNSLYYVELPVRPVELKRNLGIRYIRPVNGDISFIRVMDTELESIKSLEVYKNAKKVFYYIEGDKIYLDYSRNEFTLIDSVKIKLLPVFSDFDDSDNIEFPQGEKQPTDMVLETLGFRPTDNINNDVK